MSRLVASVVLAALLTVGAADAQVVVRSWQFNTPGDNEGWSGNAFTVNNLHVAPAVQGSETVLTCENLQNQTDPKIHWPDETISLPGAGMNWNTLAFRIRQIDVDGVTPVPFDNAGTISLYAAGGLPDLRPIPTQSGAGVTVEAQADEWIVVTYDLTAYDGDINPNARMDPMSGTDIGGGVIAGNFEIDYVVLTAVETGLPPIADAGCDQTLTDTDDDGVENVTLDGSGSTDPDGTIVSYVWKKNAAQIATGVSPTVALSVTYHPIDLTVTDNDGDTDTDSVLIAVHPYTTDPTADAGPDRNITDADLDGAETVTLDGSGSTAIAGANLTSYVWREGSATLATGATAAVTLSGGVHSITLEVADDAGRTDADTVMIRVAAPVAADWYVDAVNGDDETGDGSSAAPFRTIGAAWPSLGAGDVVALREGTYDSIEIYSTTYVGNPAPVFTDWVTFTADDGATPRMDHLWMGLSTPASTDYSDGLGGTFDAYLRLEGIHFSDGVHLGGARYVEFNGCRMTKIGPFVGSEANIEKTAVSLSGVSYVTVKSCEITETGTGVFCQGRYVNLLNNHIHDGFHDGVRPWGLWHSLIEGNRIHSFDDGVSDDEESWSKHCDLVHFSIRGPGLEGWGNHDVIFRGNTLYDCESQAVIINGYIGNQTRHGDIVIENNIFGPSHANMLNLVEKTDGLIFRNNTVCDVGDNRMFHRWPQDNYTIRIGALTGVQIYNNVVRHIGLDANAQVDYFDYNLFTAPGAPTGADGSRSYGRFDILGGSADFVNAAAFDGVLAPTSDAIDAGTALFAPTPLPATDAMGEPRDNRPDMGAVELPGRSPDAEAAPPVYNDTKTIFVDDFEDGHYKDVDPYLDAPATQGLSWRRPDGYDYKYYVKCEGLNRNTLFMPLGSEDGRVSWLLSEQGADWVDYTFEFVCSNAYVNLGGGVCVLATDENNCYFLDLSTSNGRLIRILDGVETTLADASAIGMPYNGQTSYRIGVDVEPDGVTITVDTGRDGSIDFTYTDTDAAALAAGGVGFHCDNNDKWHYQRFDDIRVELAETSASTPGDADGDGHVDINDFVILKNNFGRTDAGPSDGDFDNDGDVDINDFVILKNNFGA